MRAKEVEYLNNEIARLKVLVRRFKTNNEEYLIKKTVEKDVSSVLTDCKVFLQFAIASVIETLRRNLGKYIIF